MKRLLFLHPGPNKKTMETEKKKLEISNTKLPIELSFAYLDAYLKDKMPDIETGYLDFRVEGPNKKMKKIIEKKANFDFTHVAMTCYSQNFLQAKEIATNIRDIDPQIPIIIGGSHPTVMTTEFQDKDVEVDYIIKGEGEIPLYQVFKENEIPKVKKIISSVRPLDINSSPLINLDLYECYKNDLDFKNLYIYFSRGCINNCIFCAGRKESCYMKAYRPLVAERAFKQLRIFEEYEPDWLIIQDPIFGVSEKWLYKITERLGRRERDYRVSTEIHADLASKGRLEAITRNNINLTIGFESAAPDMLSFMKKTKDPLTYLENMERIIAHFKDKDQVLNINTIALHPRETKETLKQTFDFYKKNTRHFHDTLVKINLFRLFPGTPVFSMLDQLERDFGTKHYCKDWWLRDIDQDTAPSLIDPSKDLDFFTAIDQLHYLIEDLVVNGIHKSKNVPNQFKIGAARFLKNVREMYDFLVEFMSDYKQKNVKN